MIGYINYYLKNCSKYKSCGKQIKIMINKYKYVDNCFDLWGRSVAVNCPDMKNDSTNLNEVKSDDLVKPESKSYFFLVKRCIKI